MFLRCSLSKLCESSTLCSDGQEISWIAHYSFILSQNELKFKLQLHDNEYIVVQHSFRVFLWIFLSLPVLGINGSPVVMTPPPCSPSKMAAITFLKFY